jgi:hypothetical protein
MAAAVVAGLALVGAAEAGAATITVDCTADPSALALALINANDGDPLAITGTCKGTFAKLIAHGCGRARRGARGQRFTSVPAAEPR